MLDVRSFEAKIGCWNSITERRTQSSLFNVQRNDVRPVATFKQFKIVIWQHCITNLTGFAEIRKH